MNKLHLLKTAHGKRYWRYNDEDSDDARSGDNAASLTIIEDDCEAIGGMWEEGASVEELQERFDMEN